MDIRLDGEKVRLVLSKCLSIKVFLSLASSRTSRNLCVMVKKNVRNINYMPVLIFIKFLDLERKSSFLDRH